MNLNRLKGRVVVVTCASSGIVASEILAGAVKLDDELLAQPEDIADAVIHMSAIPDHLNFYEAMIVQK